MTGSFFLKTFFSSTGSSSSARRSDAASEVVKLESSKRLPSSVSSELKKSEKKNWRTAYLSKSPSSVSAAVSVSSRRFLGGVFAFSSTLTLAALASSSRFCFSRKPNQHQNPNKLQKLVFLRNQIKHHQILASASMLESD